MKLKRLLMNLSITILPIKDGIIIPKDLYNEYDIFDF